MNQEQKEKLIECVKAFTVQSTLTQSENFHIAIAIEYVCHKSITYDQLSELFHCSRSTIKRAFHDPILLNIFGSNFIKALQEKGKANKQNAYQRVNKEKRSLESWGLSTEQLLELHFIKHSDIQFLSEKELNMLKTALLFLKFGSEHGYSFIANQIHKSKATISYYLTSSHLKELLKDVYYEEIQKMLKEKTPAPSRLIQKKQEKIIKILDYLEQHDLENESLRMIGKGLNMNHSILNLYLNDPYFEELQNRRKK